MQIVIWRTCKNVRLSGPSSDFLARAQEASCILNKLQAVLRQTVRDFPENCLPTTHLLS